MPFRNYFCIWFLTRGIKAEKLYHIVNQMKIGSAVADKHGRRAASRRTCYKQIRWTLSVINLRPNYIRWQRFVSKVAKLQIPHLYLTYPHLYLAPPLGETPFAFCRDFRNQKTRLSGLVWRYLRDPTFSCFSIEHRLVTDGRTGTGQQLIPALASVAQVKKIGTKFEFHLLEIVLAALYSSRSRHLNLICQHLKCSAEHLLT